MIQKRMTQSERQKQIVAEAMKIINREGYAAFTIRRLAREIGISEPAIYRHFASKDEIIISIISRMDDLWSELDLLLQGIDDDDIEEKFCTFIMMHFRYIENNPDILAVLFADEYIRLNKAVREHLYRVTDKRFNFLNELIEKIIESNMTKGINPKALAIIIVGAIRTTALNWRNANYSYSLVEMGEDICINLANMILCNKK